MEPTPPRTRASSQQSRAQRAAARKARTQARQRRTLVVVVALVAVVAVSAFGGKAVLGALSRPKASPTAQATSDVAQAEPSAKPVVATASVEPTPQPEPKPKPKPKPVSKTPEAVRKAAVDYPGAPSIDPHSFAQLEPKHRYIAITVDDGIPFDQKMLDLFVENDVKCTTFLLGEAVKSNPKMVKKMKAAGFEIANHSWDHPFMTNQSDEEIRSQLNRTQKRITAITGNQAPYFRPPYGDTNKRVKEIAAEEGYNVVMWSKSFGDSGKHANASNCYDRALEGLGPGDIVLCHWGKDHTYEAMKRFLKEIKRRDLTPVTISELVADSK